MEIISSSSSSRKRKTRPTKVTQRYPELIQPLSPPKRVMNQGKVKSRDTNQEEDAEFPVECILDKRPTKNSVEYLVKWECYEETAWLPVEELENCAELLEQFEKQRKLVHPLPNKDLRNEQHQPEPEQQQQQQHEDLNKPAQQVESSSPSPPLIQLPPSFDQIGTGSCLLAPSIPLNNNKDHQAHHDSRSPTCDSPSPSSVLSLDETGFVIEWVGFRSAWKTGLESLAKVQSNETTEPQTPEPHPDTPTNSNSNNNNNNNNNNTVLLEHLHSPQPQPEPQPQPQQQQQQQHVSIDSISVNTLESLDDYYAYLQDSAPMSPFEEDEFQCLELDLHQPPTQSPPSDSYTLTPLSSSSSSPVSSSLSPVSSSSSLAEPQFPEYDLPIEDSSSSPSSSSSSVNKHRVVDSFSSGLTHSQYSFIHFNNKVKKNHKLSRKNQILTKQQQRNLKRHGTLSNVPPKKNNNNNNILTNNTTTSNHKKLFPSLFPTSHFNMFTLDQQINPALVEQLCGNISPLHTEWYYDHPNSSCSSYSSDMDFLASCSDSSPIGNNLFTADYNNGCKDMDAGEVLLSSEVQEAMRMTTADVLRMRLLARAMAKEELTT